MYLCDTTPEGERLGAALRARGYSVADVELTELAARSAKSMPQLVVCDLDARGSKDALAAFAVLPDADRADVLAIAETSASLEHAAAHLGSRPAAHVLRPVDPYAALRVVEALIGAPSGLPGGSLPPPSRQSPRPAPQRPAAASMVPLAGHEAGASSADGARGATRDGGNLQASGAVGAASKAARLSAGAAGGELPPVVDSTLPPEGISSHLSDPNPSVTDGLLTSLVWEGHSGAAAGLDAADEPESIAFAVPAGEPRPLALSSEIPQVEVSRELSELLERAERSVAQQSVASADEASDRPPSEDDLVAPVAASVLAALDAPLDSLDDVDDSASGVAPGTHGGSDPSRTGPTGNAEAGEGSSQQQRDAPVGATSVEDPRSRPSGLTAQGTGVQVATGSGSGAGMHPTNPDGRPSLLPPGVMGDETASGTGAGATGTSGLGTQADTADPAPLTVRQSIPAPPGSSGRTEPAPQGRASAEMSTSAPPALARPQPTGRSELNEPDGSALAPLPRERPSPMGDDAKLPSIDRGAPTVAPAGLDVSRPSPSKLAPPPLPDVADLDQPPGVRNAASSSPPRAASRPASAPPPGVWAPSPREATVQIPSRLGRYDAARVIAQVIRARYSGSLAIESEDGIRRLVLRDGDFVTAASSSPAESLVAFLVGRGVLSRTVESALGRKLAPFGKHAGAALVAHGHLRQDELWSVLRAHAEWIVGRAVGIAQGAASLEQEVPARLKAEPAVFGGATGAEVFVEMLRRAVSPSQAVAALGGETRLEEGAAVSLLSECSLPDHELSLVNRATRSTVEQAVAAGGSPELGSVLFALTLLGILRRPATRELPREEASPSETASSEDLDDAACRARIAARKALVDEGDYFSVLGLERDATAYEVKRAYLLLRREFEPSRILTAGIADLSEDVDEIVQVVEEAYEILRDQVRRDRYRRALDASPEG